jgi:hypothetical protein
MVSDLWKVFIPDGASATINALSADERRQLWRAWEINSVYTRCARWLAEQVNL